MIPVEGRPLRRGERALLAAEILFDYARAHRLMRRTDLADALRRLREHPVPAAPAPAVNHTTALRLGRAVMLTLRRLPTDRRCLVRSLVVCGMLARRGTPSELVLGVPGDRARPFVAHAWVEHAGGCVLPDEGFSRLHAL